VSRKTDRWSEAALMSNANAQIDATFYQMIHQFVHTPKGGESDDRRRQKRERFPEIQWIAPWNGFRFPAESEFLEVQCYDLTRGGFSFLFPHRPMFPFLVAGFGQKPDLLYIGAEPVRSIPVLLFPTGRVKHIREGEAEIDRRSSTGELGRPMMLVGCRFTRRLTPPSETDRAAS
jgi:hypothetical protein